MNVLRGVICLCVMGLHFAFLFRTDGGWADWLGQFRPGVESFFVLSGYFLAGTYRPRPTDMHFSIPGLVARRLVRLVVPYWVAVGLVYLLPSWRLLAPAITERVPAAGKAADTSLADVIANLTGTADLFGRPLAMFTFWSLASLLQLHVLFSALFWLVRWAFLREDDGRHHTRTLGVMHLLVAVGTLVSAGFAWDDHWGPNPTQPSGWKLPDWFVYVGVGWAVYWAAGSGLRWLNVGVILASLVGAIATTSPRPFFAAGTAVALVWCTRRPAALSGRAWGPLRAIGRLSYSVYLVHGIVGYRAMTALSWAGVPQSDGWVVLHFAVAAVASVAVAALFHRLVETPVGRWASAIRYRNTAGPTTG